MTKYGMRLSIFIVLIFAISFISFSQEIDLATIQSTDSLPFDSQVKRGRLSNGLTYYLANRKNSQGKLLINFHIRAGNYQEDKDQAEAAHFVEHLVLRRSRHFPTLNSFRDYLNGAGVMASNGTAQLDVTSYFFETPSDTSIVTNIFMAISDWVSDQAIIEEEDITATKSIISEEVKLGAGSSIDRFLQIRLLEPSRFSETELQSKRIGGRYSTLSSTAIKRFYRDWYRPNLGALIIVGDFDTQIMELLIHRVFTFLKNPINERVHVDYPFRLTGRNRYLSDSYLSHRDHNIYIDAYYKQELHPMTKVSDYRLSVVVDFVNDLMLSRFSNLYKEGAPPFSIRAVFAKGIAAMTSLRVSALRFRAQCTRPSDIQVCYRALFMEIERLKRYGFSARELENSRAKLVSATQANRIVTIYEYSDFLKAHFLYQEAVPSAGFREQLRFKFLSEITVDEINDVIREWLRDTNRDITLLVPRSVKSNVPNENRVLTWLREIRNEFIDRYEMQEKAAVKVDFNLLYSFPSSVDYTRQDERLGITRLHLANGVRVILKTTSSSSNSRVYLQSTRPLGLSRYSNTASYLSAKLAADLILPAGLGELSLGELEEYCKKKHLRTSFVMTEVESILSGSAPYDGIEALFQIVYRYFLPPRIDSVMYQSKLSHFKQWANFSKTSMERDLFLLLGRHFNAYQGFSVDELDQIDSALCLESYAECFSSPQEFLFVITGVHDMDEAVALAVKYLGNLPVRRATMLKVPSTQSNIKTSFPSVSMAFVNKGFSKDKAIVWLLYPCIELSSIKERLSFDFLMKITEFVAYRRLRELEGGVYFPTLGTQKIDSQFGHDRYIADLQFACKPETIERVISAAREEIKSLRDNGPTVDDLRAAHLYFKQHMNDARWNSYLAELYRQPKPPALVSDLGELIDAVNSDDVQQAALHYLSENCFLRCVEVPEDFK